jgi:hypothetical protein
MNVLNGVLLHERIGSDELLTISDVPLPPPNDLELGH